MPKESKYYLYGDDERPARLDTETFDDGGVRWEIYLWGDQGFQKSDMFRADLNQRSYEITEEEFEKLTAEWKEPSEG